MSTTWLKKNPWLLFALVFACGGSTAAGSDAGTVVDAPAPMIDAELPDAPPPAPHYQFVVTTIDVPESTAEATLLGLDIDGDTMMEPDNQLGVILAAVGSLGGTSPQLAIDQLVNDGAIIHLVDVETPSFTDTTYAFFWMFIGEDSDQPPDASDNFSGSEMFNIATGSPLDGRLPGNVTSSVLRAGPGTVPLQIALTFLGMPFTIHLVGARVEATVDQNGITNGRIGGGVTENEIDTLVIPGVHDAIADVVAADCTLGVCTPGSGGETLLNLFDTDNDGKVSLDEVRNAPLIQSAFTPDIDLFDQNGNFNPRQDGVNDAVSLGVGFTAVGAQFLLP